MNLSKIVRSSCRRRILKVLSKKQELNIMRLVRAVNSTYNEVDRNLLILADEGIIAQNYLGRKRIVRLNFENKKTLVILKILKLLNDSVDLKQLQRKLSLIIEGNSN